MGFHKSRNLVVRGMLQCTQKFGSPHFQDQVVKAWGMDSITIKCMKNYLVSFSEFIIQWEAILFLINVSDGANTEQQWSE